MRLMFNVGNKLANVKMLKWCQVSYICDTLVRKANIYAYDLKITLLSPRTQILTIKVNLDGLFLPLYTAFAAFKYQYVFCGKGQWHAKGIKRCEIHSYFKQHHWPLPDTGSKEETEPTLKTAHNIFPVHCRQRTKFKTNRMIKVLALQQHRQRFCLP